MYLAACMHMHPIAFELPLRESAMTKIAEILMVKSEHY